MSYEYIKFSSVKFIHKSINTRQPSENWKTSIAFDNTIATLTLVYIYIY